MNATSTHAAAGRLVAASRGGVIIGQSYFVLRERGRFHHITVPVMACATAARLASDIRIFVGIPNTSPVCTARLRLTSRVPAAVVLELSACSTAPLEGST